MKKYFFGILIALIFILSYKTDSFADGFTGFSIYGDSGTDEHHSSTRITFNASGLDDDLKFCCVGSIISGNLTIDQVFCNKEVDVPITISRSYWERDGNIWTPHTSVVSSIAHFSGDTINNHRCYVYIHSYIMQVNCESSVPVYTNRAAGAEYVTSLSSDYETSLGGPANVDQLGFGSVEGSSSIPTPVVNWVLNDDGSLSRTLQFSNAQLPQNPNIRMGLQLIVHWASIDNITMSYANQSASALGTGYQVFYDNALSQDGLPMGYPLPANVSQFKPCPSEINFLTNSESVTLFNNFLVSHPVSERIINYSPSGISSFADSFRNHLGDINFPYNVPYVSARYYYMTSDGTGLIFGGWTNTYPKLPSQGAVLSINKQNGQIYVPVNDGTFNEGTDIDGNPIFDNGTTIVSPDLVNFDDLNNSVESLFSYLGQFPSFLSRLFPFLPSWVPIFLASIIGITLVVGIVRIILK